VSSSKSFYSLLQKLQVTGSVVHCPAAAHDTTAAQLRTFILLINCCYTNIATQKNNISTLYLLPTTAALWHLRKTFTYLLTKIIKIG